MAVKKSELYSSIWEACNTFRGGMDTEQVKKIALEITMLGADGIKTEKDGYKLNSIPDKTFRGLQLLAFFMQAGLLLYPKWFHNWECHMKENISF